MDIKILSHRLREARKRLNLSQADVAKIVGFSAVVVSQHETGTAIPGSDKISKYADCYQTTTDYLLGRTDDPSPPLLTKDPPGLAYLMARQNEFLTSSEQRITEQERLYLRNAPASFPVITLTSLLNESLFDHDTWASVSISGSSTPENMSGIDRDSIDSFTRNEWALWERLLVRFHAKTLKRMPTFSDYCIVYPDPTEVDPRSMMMNASVKYTTEESLLIVKGRIVQNRPSRNIRGYGWEQMRGLCRALIEIEDYCGENFSYGDKYIWGCANGTVSPGNPEIWVRVGTNHHVTYVVDQLAKHHAQQSS